MWIVPPPAARIAEKGFPATLAPMWMGLLARPSAMSLPVAETVTVFSLAMRTSAQGSIVIVPLIVASEGRMCGLLSAVQVSVLSGPECDVGPAEGFGQSMATPRATSARI